MTGLDLGGVTVDGDGLLLGTVPYLNVQPMVWAIERGLVRGSGGVEIVGEVPRKLADSLAGGKFDAAIVPVFEHLRRRDFYRYVQGPVIACVGAVRSVMLYSSVPWERVRRVYLDVSSLTSVHLFKVLAAEAGIVPEYVDTGVEAVPLPLPAETGWVVIGDPAIAEWGKHAYTLDLGLAWQELTGLPFVFAAWLVPVGVEKRGLTEILNESLRVGMENLERVASDSAERFGVSAEFALRYFREFIQYDLGERELAGWKRFADLCHKHGLIDNIPEFREYV